MRPIHSARLDKTRPVLILTRDVVRPHLSRVTVAPITSTIRRLSTEVPVGTANGLDHDSLSVATISLRCLSERSDASWASC